MQEYTLGEIASSLDVGERTLRRWSEMLEENGYEFQKRDRSRIYSDRELSMFTQMKNLIKGLTATEASSYVLLNNATTTGTSSLLESIRTFDEYLSKFEREFFWDGRQSLDTLKTQWDQFKKSQGIQHVPDSNEREITVG